MEKFQVAYAMGEDWAHATKDCCGSLGHVSKPSAGMVWQGFLYATTHVAADIGSILGYIRNKTGIQRWSGTIGGGILANEWECHEYPAIVAMIAQFPISSVHTLNTVTEGYGDVSANTRKWVDNVSPGVVVVHGDPTNTETLNAVESLSIGLGGVGGGAYLVGGLTYSGSEQFQIADRLTGGGVSGVAFGPDVKVAIGLTQGCMPLGDAHLVTDAIDNVIIALDGRPAMSVLKNEMAGVLEYDPELIAGHVHVAFPVVGSDMRDYTVRNLNAIEPEQGWLALGDRVLVGERILFVRRDPVYARADMDQMLDDLRTRITTQPRGALYFSCMERGPQLFGAQGEEARILRQGLGGDVPIVGFFGNGEISNGRLYTYAGVLTLFL